jgi:AcrR family transcriptional regulator
MKENLQINWQPLPACQGKRPPAMPQPPTAPEKNCLAEPATARDEQRSRRQEAIIRAASKLFAELGYAGCEMERVAEEVKVAKGTLYLYFPSKEALFLAAVDWGMRQMQLEVARAAEEERDAFERIARAIRAYLTFFAEHPEFVELIIQERAIFKHRKRPTYYEYRDAARIRWRAFYQQLIDEGKLRADLEVEAILDTVGNLLYGTMFTNHFLGHVATIDQQHQQMVDLILRGMLSQQEQDLRRAAAPQPTPRSGDARADDNAGAP